MLAMEQQRRLFAQRRPRHGWRWFAALAVLLLSDQVDASEPLAPEAALVDFRLPDGYQIELVAAEPEVVDPVAVAFDPQGRLWVVEMRDYPLLPEGGKPSSCIKIFEDKDHDGRFESARVFADGLLFPTGLQLWGSGAFVTLAGEIAYFPDDDGDGRADKKETWYQGFAELNEQLRANHPTLAADGWIYVAGGLRGGQIKNLRLPDAPSLSINGRDFAFNPRTGECRAVSGNGQFGLTLDDFGRRFTCSNRNPLIEVMIEQRYLDRNPKLVLSRIVQDAAAAGADSRIFPRSRAITTSAQHSGQFTAACGVELNRGGGALPDAAANDAFVCEPTANLVHRERVTSDGSTMRARPIDDKSEFLTATDEWFRPVNLSIGPDGALYVVDMYRAVIEHPEWMPPELRNRPDMHDGRDRGRIYRIRAAAPRAGNAIPEPLTSSVADELASLLESPNPWIRDTAARRLLELNDASVLPTLSTLARGSYSPATRYVAMQTLVAMGGMTPAIAAQALADSSPEIRSLGLTLCEPFLEHSPELARQAMELASDDDARVRFQTALTSMFLPAAEALQPLKQIAAASGDDLWICRAVALASRELASPLLLALLDQASPQLAGQDDVAVSPTLLRELLPAIVASGNVEQVAVVLERVDRVNSPTARMLLEAANDALQLHGTSLPAALALVAEQNKSAVEASLRLFDEALSEFSTTTSDASERIAAAKLLRFDSRPTTGAALLEILQASPPPEIQTAAIAALQSQATPAVAEAILSLFPEQLPAIRRASLDLLCTQPAWTSQLLTAAADGAIEAADIDPARRLQLMQHADADIRRQAEQLFAAQLKSREEVISRYQAALELTGDPGRGREAFAVNCASCHRVGDQGTAIGPDIGDSSMKTSAQLLTDILDPNRAVDANFVNYVALTYDGVGHSGIISSETSSGIVLLGADGKQVAILREDLESLTSGKSLMPEGLEQQLDLQKMADLLAFLKTWRHAAELQAERPAKIGSAAITP